MIVRAIVQVHQARIVAIKNYRKDCIVKFKIECSNCGSKDFHQVNSCCDDVIECYDCGMQYMDDDNGSIFFRNNSDNEWTLFKKY